MPIFSLAGRTTKAIASQSGRTSAVTTLSGTYMYPPLKTGQTQCWDAAGTLIACAGTGQGGEYRAGVTLSYTGPTQHGYPFWQWGNFKYGKD